MTLEMVYTDIKALTKLLGAAYPNDDGGGGQGKGRGGGKGRGESGRRGRGR